MADAAQTIDFMDHVRATGCAFALDDFGAGATGFQLLPRLPLRHRQDRRRLRSRRRRGNRDAQVLVECLAGVARHFEMMIVAEQVETEADAAWLRHARVDCLQGYLYGRPSARPVAAACGRRGHAARRLAG